MSKPQLQNLLFFVPVTEISRFQLGNAVACGEILFRTCRNKLCLVKRNNISNFGPDLRRSGGDILNNTLSICNFFWVANTVDNFRSRFLKPYFFKLPFYTIITPIWSLVSDNFGANYLLSFWVHILWTAPYDM